MSSREKVQGQRDMCSWRINNQVSSKLIANMSPWNVDYFLRGAAAMEVDFSKFDYLSDLKQRDAIFEHVVVLNVFAHFDASKYLA